MPDLSDWSTLNALALQHREGWRSFHRDSQAEIRYEIARLPDGKSALRMTAAYLCGDNHRVTIPWRLYPNRDEALKAFLEQTKRHFTIPASPDQMQTQKRIMTLLKGIDAGFPEPTPEPIQNEKSTQTQAEKVKAKREKPVQKELF